MAVVVFFFYPVSISPEGTAEMSIRPTNGVPTGIGRQIPRGDGFSLRQRPHALGVPG